MRLNRADKFKIEDIAKKYNLSIEEVKKIIAAPYEFIQAVSKETILKDNMTKEEFLEVKTNFNLPSLGKLYASNFMYNEIQKRKEKEKN